MVTALVPRRIPTTDLVHRCPSKLASPDHQRVVEQAALFQVRQQGCRRPIGHPAVNFQQLVEIQVVVPVGVKQLNKTHSPLDHPPGQQTIRSIPPRRLIIQPVHLQRRRRFIREVQQVGSFGLHPVGQFIGRDAGRDLVIPGLLQTQRVESPNGVHPNPLEHLADPGRVLQVQDRLTFTAERHSAIGRREKPVCPQ